MKYYFWFIVGLCLLGGCKQHTYTTEYLLEHRLLLEKEVERCKSDAALSIAPDRYCDTVAHAEQLFLEKMEVFERDRLSFGMALLQAQMELAALNHSMQKASANEKKVLLERAKQLRHQIQFQYEILSVYSPE